MVRLDQEKDIETLRQAAVLLERENQRLTSKVLELTRQLVHLRGGDAEQLRLQIAELEQQLARRNHMVFGRSSEKRGTGERGQGEKPEQKTPKGHGPRSQPELPLVEREIALDPADQVCPSCGGALEEWEGQAEQSEEIEVIERRFVRTKIRRKKYRCRCGGCVETAPAPLKLIAGGRYSVSFAVEVAVSKYLDHLPLERQVRIMAREGLVVDSQTLWDQLNRLASVLEAAYERLRIYVLTHPVVFADETRWRLLGKRSKDENKTWQVWVLAARNAVFYRIQGSRSTAAAEKMLEGYQGTVMCDGYKAYSSFAAEQPGIRLAHCWSHVRREYLAIEQFFPEQVGEILELIGELYEVERLCPAGPEGDELRARLRQERSRGIVQRIQQWALDVRALPESGLEKAIRYMAGVWSGLTVFLEDPRVPLDNNAAERAVRGPVIGRKNHYGSKSRRGTEVAALLYSLLESAKLAGVEPKSYLRAATLAGLEGETIPLPHELVDSLGPEQVAQGPVANEPPSAATP
jgi:transposase